MDQPKDEESEENLALDMSWRTDDLLFAIFLFFVITSICNITRQIVLQNNVLPLDQIQKLAIAEIIGTIETTVIMFEINMIVYPLWGVVPYTLLVFAALHWQTLRPDEYQYDANPLTLITKHIEGNIGTPVNNLYQRFEFVVIMMWCEGIGALLAYGLLVNLIWANAHLWEFFNKDQNYHYHLFKTANEWETSITGDPTFAAFVEGFFSLAQYIWPIIIARKNFDENSALVYINSGKAVFAGLGAAYTGGYFNPIVAFALEYKTHGHSLLTKTVVYWIAPIIGTVSGIAVRKLFF